MTGSSSTTSTVAPGMRRCYRRPAVAQGDPARMTCPARVAQGIEHRPPEPGAQVRILPRAPLRCLGTSCTVVLRRPSRFPLSLVVASRVEGELPDQLAVLGEHADVEVVDQQQHAFTGTGPPDPD